MSQITESKVQLANELKSKLTKANLAVFADYKGLTATKADEFRKTIRALNSEVKVLKNNVARKAVADGSFGEESKAVMDDLVGPTMVAFSYGDAAAVAKAVYEFSKANEEFKLKDSLMGKKKIAAEDVAVLANLPTKEVLLSMFLRTLNAPVSNFVGVLAAVPRSLLNVLVALEKKKKESA